MTYPDSVIQNLKFYDFRDRMMRHFGDADSIFAIISLHPALVFYEDIQYLKTAI